VLAQLHREAEVLSEEPREDGVRVRARVGERLFAAIRPYVVEGDRSAAPAGGG
jgi:hypothetical protein